MSWSDELAKTLGEEPLSAAATERLLAVSREVAHRVERRVTPLAAFLVGSAVGRAPTGRDEALEAALARLEGLLPEPPAEA
jgi:hypothetical protein